MTSHTVPTTARAESETVHMSVAVAWDDSVIACIEVATVHIETAIDYMRNFEPSAQPLKKAKSPFARMTMQITKIKN